MIIFSRYFVDSCGGKYLSSFFAEKDNFDSLLFFGNASFIIETVSYTHLEWVKFPTTSEELQKVFERIGIGSKDDFGNPYEEWFISDYDCYVDGDVYKRQTSTLY